VVGFEGGLKIEERKAVVLSDGIYIFLSNQSGASRAGGNEGKLMVCCTRM
jgi:hypothetical protein